MSFKISNEHGAVAIKHETVAFVPYDSFVWTTKKDQGVLFMIDENGYLKHNDLFVIVNSTRDDENLYRFYLTKFDTLLRRDVVGRRVKAEVVGNEMIFRTVPGSFDTTNESLLGKYFALVNKKYKNEEIIKPEKFFRKIMIDGKQIQGSSLQSQQVGIPDNLRWPKQQKAAKPQQTKQQAVQQSHKYLDRVIGLLEKNTGKKFDIKVRLLSLYQTLLDTKKQNLGLQKTKIQEIKTAFVGSVGQFYVVDGRGGGLRYESDRFSYTTNSFTPFRFDTDLNLFVGTLVVSKPDTKTRAIVHAGGSVDLIRNDYYLLNTGNYKNGDSIRFEKEKPSPWKLQPVGRQDPMTKEQQQAVQQRIHAARQALHKRLEPKALREAIASEKSTPEFRQELKKKLAELLAKRGRGGFGGSTAAPKKKQQGWSAPCTPEQYYDLYYKAVQGP